MSMHVDHFAMQRKSEDLQTFHSKRLLMLLQENTDLGIGIHLGALKAAQTISNKRMTGPKFLAAMKLLKRLRMEGHAIIHHMIHIVIKAVMILCLMIADGRRVRIALTRLFVFLITSWISSVLTRT